MSFIFGGNTDVSYEELQRRRAIAAQMMGNGQGQISNVGEGINRASSMIMGALVERKANREEERQRELFSSEFDSIFGADGSVTAPSFNTAPMASGGSSGSSGSSGAGNRGGGWSAEGVDPRFTQTESLDPRAAMPSQADPADLQTSALFANAREAEGVDDRLTEVLAEVARRGGPRFGLSDGLRTIEEQRGHVAAGRSQTMNSKHLHGNAMDIHLLDENGNADWDFDKYEDFYRNHVQPVAAEMGYDIKWGGDWNTLKDGVHFQVQPREGEAGTRPQGARPPAAARGPSSPVAAGGSAPAGNRSAAISAAMTEAPDPNRIAQMAAVAASPYASAQQRAIAQAMMTQEQQKLAAYQQQQDPMYQAQLAKLQREAQAGQKRETFKAADGYLYYADGTRVLPDVVNPDTPQPGTINADQLSAERDLRKDFTAERPVQEFQKQSAAFGRIIESAEDPSAAGDLALIFNYMKLLDPGSVVRESEFATAENARAWLENTEEGQKMPGFIASSIRRLESGQRLSEDQRTDFVSRAGKLYQGAEQQINSLYDQYEGIAQAGGLDPSRSVLDYRYQDTAPAPVFSPMPGARPASITAPPQAAPQPQPMAQPAQAMPVAQPAAQPAQAAQPVDPTTVPSREAAAYVEARQQNEAVADQQAAERVAESNSKDRDEGVKLAIPEASDEEFWTDPDIKKVLDEVFGGDVGAMRQAMQEGLGQ